MLTIVIPSYNHADYIVASLSAALAVDVPGKKVLLVDDGSSDNSMFLVRDYLARNDPAGSVQLIEKKNGGLVSSLNIALGLVDTKYCWFVASDDELKPGGVLKLFNEMLAREELAFVIGGGQYFDSAGDVGSIYNARHDRFFGLSRAQRDREMYTNYPSPILLQSTIFKTDALRGIGGWDPSIRLDDYSTFVKMLRNYKTVGCDFAFMPQIDCVGYRLHDTNSSKNLSSQLRLVRGALMALAPESLRRTAITNAIAYYSLNALKYRRFDFFSNCIRECGIGYTMLGTLKMPVVALQHVMARK
ncbi:glycosyltransferase family 2 protein [Pseudomonas putida]|uniref:Glycosyltransferase 2-like domain-containing protein n=1 Tax=Pseudomonas putida TaxID=303 RepID=A0A2S3WI37_PSEPU|nr:glycosyltransferase family 2 protein [Pseudomonas putida]POF90278.1 hypothetical protein BGP80_21005 [Pseudomonas putida]